MILLASDFVLPAEPWTHELNGPFWREIAARVGPLMIMARGVGERTIDTRVGNLHFFTYPARAGRIRFLSAMHARLHSVSPPVLVWCSEPMTSPLVAMRRWRNVPTLLEVQGDLLEPLTGSIARR